MSPTDKRVELVIDQKGRVIATDGNGTRRRIGDALTSFWGVASIFLTVFGAGSMIGTQLHALNAKLDALMAEHVCVADLVEADRIKQTRNPAQVALTFSDWREIRSSVRASR